MTSQPDPFAQAIAMVAEQRATIENLEAALLEFQRVFGHTFQALSQRLADVGPRPDQAPAPEPAARVPRRTMANVPPPPPTFGPKPRAKREDVTARVLSFLADQKAPVMFAQIAKATGGTKAYVREAINGLVNAGRVVRNGVKAGQKIGLPAVMAAVGKVSGKAPAGVKPTAPAISTARTGPAAAPELSPVRVAIWKVLKTGASVDPGELRRKLDGKVPESSMANIVDELEALAKSGRVERISISPTVRRYRALFPGRATA